MQITIDLPDDLVQTNTFNESDWLREIAIALFQQERIAPVLPASYFMS